MAEYWSAAKKDANPLAITPTLQYSNAPKLIEIESSPHGLPPFGLFIRKYEKFNIYHHKVNYFNRFLNALTAVK